MSKYLFYILVPLFFVACNQNEANNNDKAKEDALNEVFQKTKLCQDVQGEQEALLTAVNTLVFIDKNQCNKEYWSMDYHEDMKSEGFTLLAVRVAPYIPNKNQYRIELFPVYKHTDGRLEAEVFSCEILPNAKSVFTQNGSPSC